MKDFSVTRLVFTAYELGLVAANLAFTKSSPPDADAPKGRPWSYVIRKPATKVESQP